MTPYRALVVGIRRRLRHGVDSVGARSSPASMSPVGTGASGASDTSDRPGTPDPPVDLEYSVTRTELRSFAEAIVDPRDTLALPISPDGLAATIGYAIRGAGGIGHATVSRSPAGFYSPEYWQIRVEAADGRTRAILDDAVRRRREP